MNTIAVRGMKRKNFLIPEELNTQAEETARNLGLDLSELIRIAIRDFVQRVERERREKELAAACEEYYDFNRSFSQEWAKFETRVE